MEKEILEAMDKGFATIESKLESQVAELNETAKKILEVKPEDVQTKEDVDAEDKAKLERDGALEGITKMEVWDIPVGQALVGGFGAVFASELIDGFLAAQSSMVKGLVKLAGAGAAIRWGGRLLGSTGSKALGILLAYDGLRMIIPIDEWASRFAGGATRLTGGGLGGRAGLGNVGGGGNGSKATEDYYARALGR